MVEGEAAENVIEDPSIDPMTPAEPRSAIGVTKGTPTKGKVHFRRRIAVGRSRRCCGGVLLLNV